MYDSEYCTLCNNVPATRNFIHYLSLNMEKFEGYDIFQVYEMGERVFISKRFLDFCQKNKLTNLYCRPAEIYCKKEVEYFLGRE